MDILTYSKANQIFNNMNLNYRAYDHFFEKNTLLNTTDYETILHVTGAGYFDNIIFRNADNSPAYLKITVDDVVIYEMEIKSTGVIGLFNGYNCGLSSNYLRSCYFPNDNIGVLNGLPIDLSNEDINLKPSHLLNQLFIFNKNLKVEIKKNNSGNVCAYLMTGGVYIGT